jgi:hypothetical protein
MEPRSHPPLTRLTFVLFALVVALACAVSACSSSAGSLPGALRDPFAVTAFDSTRGVTVLFGSLGGSRAGETWEWDGTTWTLRATTGPSPRQGHAMAFDAGRGVTVLFGGFEGNGLLNGETWEWDGSTWTLRSSSGPAPRYGHALVYDSVRGSLFLFGGFKGTTDGETWEYTGTNGRWFLRSATGGPSGRLRHAMVFDSVRNVSLVFGGQDTDAADGVFSNDLWQWESQPRRWTQLPSAPPPSRYLHGMVFDSARGVALLFGGLELGYAYGADTWAWDGTAWTQESTPTEPSPRAAHAMAFDSTRNVAVLFGGFDGTFNRETWEWDGTQWAQREATFATPRLPVSLGRGFLILEHGDHVRSQPFELNAAPSGLRLDRVEALAAR